MHLSSGPSVSSDHDVSTSSSHSNSQSLDSSKPNTMVNQNLRDSKMEMEESGSDDNRRVAKRLSDNESPSNSPGKRHKTDSVENIPSLVNKVATDDPAGATSLSSEAKEEVLASGKHPTDEEMHSDTSAKRTKPDFKKEMSFSDGDEDKPNEHVIILEENVNIVTSLEGDTGASTAGVLQPTVDSSSEDNDSSITVSSETQRHTMPDGPEMNEVNSKPVQDSPISSFNTIDLNQTNEKFETEKSSTHSQSTDASSKDDPLFIAEDPGSSNPSSPAPSTDKGNNSESSSDRTESKVNLQNF